MHTVVEMVISEHIIVTKLKMEQKDIIINTTFKILIKKSDIGICKLPNRGVPTSKIIPR